MKHAFTDMLKCGIVVLNYFNYSETIEYILKIKDYNSVSVIIVVDNASPNESFQKLSEHQSEKIKVISTPCNGGYSFGNNFGVRYLLKNYNVDIIGISNPDVSYPETFIKKILIDFSNNSKMAIITGLQKDKNGELAIHPFWPNYTVRQYFRFKRHSLRSVYHLVKYSSDYKYAAKKLSENIDLFEVGTVEGSLFFVRKEAFESVGFFDENISFYHEEDILAKKMFSIGGLVGVDPSISYIHYGAQTTTKVFTSSIKAKHSFQSSIYYFNKYLSKNPFLRLANLLLCLTIRIEDSIVCGIKKIFGKRKK